MYTCMCIDGIQVITFKHFSENIAFFSLKIDLVSEKNSAYPAELPHNCQYTRLRVFSLQSTL